MTPARVIPLSRCSGGSLDPLFSSSLCFVRAAPRVQPLSFHKQDTIIVRRPIIDNLLELETRLSYFVDQDSLLDAMIFAIFRYALYLAVLGMRRKINDRQLSSRFQRANQTRIELQRLRQMMIDAPQNNRVATSFRQIGYPFPTLHHDDILQFSFLHFGSQRFEFLRVNLRGEHFSRPADLLDGGKCVTSIARADIRDHRSRLPLHKRRELRNFIRGRSRYAQRECERYRCCDTQSKQSPFADS